MIAMGPKKRGGGPPPDLESPGAKKPPFGASKSPMPETGPSHEDAETPAVEGQEESGMKMMQAIESAGEAQGLDPQQSRDFAAACFRAMADCMGGKPESNEAQSDEQNPDGIY